MASTGGTILDRAVRSWSSSPVVYIAPVLAWPQPEQFELARRIAQEHPGRFDDELVALLSSPSPVVVAQALTTLAWMRSPALADLPKELLAGKRLVLVAGCMIVSRSVGAIARDCLKEAKGSA